MFYVIWLRMHKFRNVISLSLSLSLPLLHTHTIFHPFSFQCGTFWFDTVGPLALFVEFKFIAASLMSWSKSQFHVYGREPGTKRERKRERERERERERGEREREGGESVHLHLPLSTIPKFWKIKAAPKTAKRQTGKIVIIDNFKIPVKRLRRIFCHQFHFCSHNGSRDVTSRNPSRTFGTPCTSQKRDIDILFFPVWKINDFVRLFHRIRNQNIKRLQHIKANTKPCMLPAVPFCHPWFSAHSFSSW